MSEKVYVYIDGFNMYHNLKTTYNNKYLWVNYRQIAKEVLLPGEVLGGVFYFTAYTPRDREKKERHQIFVKALQYFGCVQILGSFQRVTRSFIGKHTELVKIKKKMFGFKLPIRLLSLIIPDRLEYITHEEKKTDVNIAVKIVHDGIKMKYDKAIIMTCDTDITPAIEAVQRQNKGQKFISCVLPQSLGSNIRRICNEQRPISEKILKKCIMPDIIKLKNGEVIKRPINRY